MLILLKFNSKPENAYMGKNGSYRLPDMTHNMKMQKKRCA